MRISPGRALFMLFAAILLTSCTTARKVGKVIMDPDIQVGKAVEQPTEVTITLLAEPDINPNESGDASPIELQVVYLSEDSKLLAADYDWLVSEALDKALGKNYLDHQDYTLLPDQYKPLPAIKLDEKNRYIGVIAHYTDTNETEWKKVIKVTGVGRKYNVLIHVRADEINLRKEEEE